MRELFRDFFSKLFSTRPKGVDWQTFTVCDPANLAAAINDIKDTGYTVHEIEYTSRFTYVTAYRERV